MQSELKIVYGHLNTLTRAKLLTNLTKLDKSMHTVSQPGHWQTLCSNKTCFRALSTAVSSTEEGEFCSAEATEKHVQNCLFD